jgi:hypothetical protein
MAGLAASPADASPTPSRVPAHGSGLTPPTLCRFFYRRSMIVVSAREIPRSAIISTRSQKLLRRYQRTQRTMISRSKWRPLKRSPMHNIRVRFLQDEFAAILSRFSRLHQNPPHCSSGQKVWRRARITGLIGTKPIHPRPLFRGCGLPYRFGDLFLRMAVKPHVEDALALLPDSLSLAKSAKSAIQSETVWRGHRFLQMSMVEPPSAGQARSGLRPEVEMNTSLSAAAPAKPFRKQS